MNIKLRLIVILILLSFKVFTADMPFLKRFNNYTDSPLFVQFKDAIDQTGPLIIIQPNEYFEFTFDIGRYNAIAFRRPCKCFPCIRQTLEIWSKSIEDAEEIDVSCAPHVTRIKPYSKHKTLIAFPK